MATGAVARVRYEYPANADQLLGDVEPLLSRHGVQLVLNGHTHLWSRFRNAEGVNFLETSNVGNTFGAYPLGGSASRHLPGPDDGWRERYASQGDAGGLDPIIPSVAPELGRDGTPLPYLASDTMTAFSLLDLSPALCAHTVSTPLILTPGWSSSTSSHWAEGRHGVEVTSALVRRYGLVGRSRSGQGSCRRCVPRWCAGRRVR